MTGEVAEFYDGRSILVTGAYGFMGKVLLEKLLYACRGIKNIFILVRPKRGKSIELRLEEMLRIPLFERLRNENPSALKKIVPIQADMSLDDIGLSDESIKLLSEVSVVYHVAASLRLDAKLKDSVKMNLEGTYKFLEVCKTFQKIQAFVYVSTAFCHCELDVMEEKIYEPPVLPADIIRLCKWMDDESLRKITPNLLGVHPNAYTYTKRLAEALVSSYFPQLPVIVARPSIVTPAWKDPFPGWVDNLNGPVGLIVGGGKGVIRTMLCNADYHAEVIPVDLAINGLIAIPWHLKADPKKTFESYKETPVFNLTQSGTQPITWGEILEMGKKATHENPFEIMLWYPNGNIRNNRMVHNMCVFFYHWVPAYIIDFLLIIFGKKPFLVNVQRRITDGLEVLQYFTTREWVFKNDNLIELRESMNRNDRQKFSIDFEKVDPVYYIADCVLGARHYLLKEDPESLPKSRRLLKMLYVLDCASSGLFYILIAWLLVSCSDTARYLLDSATDGLSTMPFLRTLKY